MNILNTFVTEQTQLSLPLGTHSLPVQLIKYDANQYNDSLYSSFNIEQPSESKQWVVKRKAQFLAGRFAAKYALKTIGADYETTIYIGKHREPLWSNNIIGSISHSDGISIAIAQFQASPNQGIGLDIQTILSDQEISDSANVVLTINDKTFLKKEDRNYSYNQLFTLLFSVKESFFKAVFKEVGKHFDFNVMSLKSIDFEAQTLILRCEKMLSKQIVSGSEHLFHFTYLDSDKPLFITYYSFNETTKPSSC